MDKSMHTVTLDYDKCKGCVSCMKRCPTEAIRVRNGKAKVLYERCIGCGECVRRCPHQAKLPAYDKFETIKNFKYKIALPAPSLYGQFNNLDSIDRVLNGLIKIGFDEVFEVSAGAELITDATHRMIAQDNLKMPIINSACPAVVELINMCFKSLKGNLLQIKAPVDVAAQIARENAIKRGIPASDIGVFFISPCPAKVFALKTGMCFKKPIIDGVLAISEVYFKLNEVLKDLVDIKPLAKSGSQGINWGVTGGEAEGTNMDRYLAADGVENVLQVLHDMENGKLDYIDFVELNACPGGCVGGVLNIENPFVARARIRNLKSKLKNKVSSFEEVNKPLDFYRWEEQLEVKNVFALDDNRVLALHKMEEIEKILETLPMLDCGSCGAPSCRAFAEDVVNGEVDKDGCVRKEK
ncbi:MAG: [Fe-Fe] hydrogenase large subunit C-terminal domain-containing protein [Clostridia bacterium]